MSEQMSERLSKEVIESLFAPVLCSQSEHHINGLLQLYATLEVGTQSINRLSLLPLSRGLWWHDHYSIHFFQAKNGEVFH